MLQYYFLSVSALCFISTASSYFRKSVLMFTFFACSLKVIFLFYLKWVRNEFKYKVKSMAGRSDSQTNNQKLKDNINKMKSLREELIELESGMFSLSITRSDNQSSKIDSQLKEKIPNSNEMKLNKGQKAKSNTSSSVNLMTKGKIN